MHQLRRLLEEGFERENRNRKYPTNRGYEDYWFALPSFEGKEFFHYIRQDGMPYRILDVGCGQGLFLVDIMSRFPNVRAFGVSAFDYRAQIDNVDLRCSAGEIDYRIGDAHSLQKIFADVSGFDMIVSVRALGYMTNPLSVLRQCYNLLNPGGIVFAHDIPIFLPYETRERLKETWRNDGIESSVELSFTTGRTNVAIKKSDKRLRFPFSVDVNGCVFYKFIDERAANSQPVLQH